MAHIERALKVGSETQTYETKTVTTGIQRVIRESHEGLTDFLGIGGHTLSWVNTVGRPRSLAFRDNPYLSSDPVLAGTGFNLEEIDVLLILDISISMDFSAIVEQKKRGLKVVALLHDILPISNPEWFPAENQQYFRRYLQKLLFVADELVVTTHHVASELRALGWTIRPRLNVIPLGTSFRRLHFPPRKADEISLLYVSTVEPRKGHQQLVAAFDILRAKGLDVSLSLVGRRGWAEESLYSNIENHPDFGARLRWHREVSDHQMANIASRATLAVLPAEAEGFGLFLEEALAWGLPVVASDIPPFRERLQPGVWLSSITPKDLAETIQKASYAHTPLTKLAAPRSMRDFARELSVLLTTDRLASDVR